MRKPARWMVAVLTAAWLVPVGGQAADHVDSPATTQNGPADITDVYAWMSSDANTLNLIMSVSPFAGPGAVFSDAVQYVFHVNSMAGYGMAPTETLIMCTFAPNQRIQCWVGDQDYVVGDASVPEGLVSSSGRFRVFAGRRNDPFFFNKAGFDDVVTRVLAASASLAFDGAGCPELNIAQATLLLATLRTRPDGDDDPANNGPAEDGFAGEDVLSLVIQVDKTLVNGGGDILGVWASTHRTN